MWPQQEQVCDVYAGETFTSSIPLTSQVLDILSIPPRWYQYINIREIVKVKEINDYCINNFSDS